MGSVDVVTKSVTHLTFSTNGGAGVVASRLNSALRSAGWDSRLVSALDTDLRSRPLALPKHTIAAAIDNYVIKAHDWNALISLVRDSVSHHSSKLLKTDLLHLHWVNGMFPIELLPVKKNTPVVWTLHDKNPFTGACHYAFGCEQFKKNCGECPAVNLPFQPLVKANFEKKLRGVSSWENLVVVSPSKWLASLAAQSPILKNREIHVIPNPIDPLFFTHESTRQESSSEVTFLIIAASLDDPIKNVHLAVETFSAIHREFPMSRLVLVGKGGEKFNNLTGVVLSGTKTPSEIGRILDESDFLLVPSLGENSPSVAYEAGARGVTPLVSNSGGLPEVVDRLGSGHVFNGPQELGHLMRSCAEKQISLSQRDALRRRARELVDPARVAKSYAKLYEAA